MHHVLVKNCVLWNQVAHALSIGAELRENVDDVAFENCDVIHDIGREWTLRVYHCDAATISNVRSESASPCNGAANPSAPGTREGRSIAFIRIAFLSLHASRAPPSAERA